ncbi:MAG: 4a-hydroxytetrahydrobiopterin dehydratase [Planctomycetes bacterium]|nr:4a-hydroxytetrahydrobiopterin dehydratase [Planctomycetota bacterium]
MARPTLLTSAQIEDALRELPAWKLDAGRIGREFVFRDFDEAFAWMTAVAADAKALDHHPDWTNSYRRVTVTLQTHDAGGLTALDIALANAMERHAAARGTRERS